MVNPVANRRGRGALGCLVPIVLVAAVGYLGLQFGRPWFRNQQFQDEMKRVAEFVQSTTSDSALRVPLQARADSLGLPPAAMRNLRIRRELKPSALIIESEYTHTVHLPFIGDRVLTFRPHTSGPL